MAILDRFLGPYIEARLQKREGVIREQADEELRQRMVTRRARLIQVLEKREGFLKRTGPFSTPAHQMYLNLIGVWRNHPPSRSALAMIGRTLIGRGFQVVKVEGQESKAKTRDQERILNYFYRPSPTVAWDNVKDMMGPMAKLYITAAMFKLLGQAGWENIRDQQGNVTGFDVLFGRVEPHVDERGFFKKPAWYQYSGGSSIKRVEFPNVDDIVYFVMPDIEGYPGGSPDMEALAAHTLPADLYASLANLEIFKNINVPVGIFGLDPDLSDEEFDEFVAQLEARFQGAPNVGRAMVSTRGTVTFVPTTDGQPRDMLWQETKTQARLETSGVTGVASAKMGWTEEVNRANIREIRVDFYEHTMSPLHVMLEETIYLQVCQHLFDTDAWRVRFNPPDFATQLEQSNIDVRRVSWGLMTPNEVRVSRGQKPYPGGERFFFPLQYASITPEGEALPLVPAGPTPPGPQGQFGTNPEQGRPPREERLGPEPTPQQKRQAIYDELRRWRKKSLRLAKHGLPGHVDFVAEQIPDILAEYIRQELIGARDAQEVKAIFKQVEGIFNEAGTEDVEL